MDKKDFMRKARNILVTAATGAVVTSGLTSCNDTQKTTDEWKKIHPGATIKGGMEGTIHYLEADKATDTLAIKQIKEKYLFQMTQYEQMFDSVIIKQQKADSALLSAAQKGDLTKVQEALEIMGANVNAQDAKTGNTAAMIAKEKQPFEKAFLVAKYLVAEPGFNPDVENKDGISFMDMLDAELSKGSAAWQSISRKSDMLKPDTTRTRDNTEMDKAVAQLQKTYDGLMSTYGKEMKAALGYHASAKLSTDYESGLEDYYPALKVVVNEDGSETKIDNKNKRGYGYIETATVADVMSQTGKLEIEKLNPQNIDFKALANELTVGEMDIQPENIQEAQQSVQTTRGYNHGSIDAKTYMKVRGRRGSYQTVEIKTHVEANKVR